MTPASHHGQYYCCKPNRGNTIKLPSRLRALILPNRFRGIENAILPDELHTLELGDGFNESLDNTTLPPLAAGYQLVQGRPVLVGPLAPSSKSNSNMSPATRASIEVRPCISHSHSFSPPPRWKNTLCTTEGLNEDAATQPDLPSS